MAKIEKLVPETLHKKYVKNLKPVYSELGSNKLAPEIDALMQRCAIAMWAAGGSVDQSCVDGINEFYSPGQKSPGYLYWGLVSEVGKGGHVKTPEFFAKVLAFDETGGTHAGRAIAKAVWDNLRELLELEGEAAGENEAAECSRIYRQLLKLCSDAETKKPAKPEKAAGHYLDDLADFANLLNSAEEAANQLISETADFREKAPDNKASGQNSPEKAEPEAEPEKEKPDVDKLLAELDSLVGLSKIKENVKSLINLVKVRKMRQDMELAVAPMSLHLVFMGNPGTGKTTVARLIAQLYYAIGVLSKGQLIEVDRSGLVAGFVGQTAIKTGEVIESAKGGVLFVDEAYALASSDGGNDFGQEAIDTLLKAMEDNRDDLVVIVAGYEELMEKFISSNPGLESRFNRYFLFEDYNGDELYEIFSGLCKKNQYALSEDAMEQAKKLFKDMYEQRDDNFGNGRDVRNMFENMVSVQSDRVAAMENPSREDLMTFTKDDLEKAETMRDGN